MDRLVNEEEGDWQNTAIERHNAVARFGIFLKLIRPSYFLSIETLPEMPPHISGHTPSTAPEPEVHNCYVVLAGVGGLAGMGGMVPGAEGGPLLPPLSEGLGSQGVSFTPGSTLQEGMPFVFGSFMNPPQDTGVVGGAEPAPPGPGGQLPSFSAPSSIFSSFNMSQSLMFRMAPPPAAGEPAPTNTASTTASTTASNRRDAASAPSSVGVPFPILLFQMLMLA